MTAHPSARADALIVGGGPAGATAALLLARQGHRVVVIDREPASAHRRIPQLLMPRALASLDELGVALPDDAHRVDRVRLTASGQHTTLAWPRHRSLPDHAAVSSSTNSTLVAAAIAAGARWLAAHEATAPIIDRGFVRGAHATAPDGTRFEARATYTIVADGANSTFGRALGTFRQPTWPYALAHHGRFASTHHGDSAAEFVLDLRDRSGTPITGTGWMHPAGDGTVAVGIAMMSTAPSFHVVKPANLFARVVDEHRSRWGITGGALEPSTGRRLPLGMSVGPSAGPTYLLAGDAAGAASPMSRTGIESALQTGIYAADVVHEAIVADDASHLQRYPKLIDDRYGTYYKVGRLANRMIGQPTVGRRLEHFVTQRPSVGGAYLRIATDALRGGRGGRAETAYRMMRAISLIAPDA